ncbi:unnamed protein product [Rhizophagus irregularis]|nr:unnamed protein product [Rhizophagus irregularis]
MLGLGSLSTYQKSNNGNDLGTVLKDLGKQQERLGDLGERLGNGLGGPREITWERYWRPRERLGNVLETSGNNLGTVLETSGNSLRKAMVDAVL